MSENVNKHHQMEPWFFATSYFLTVISELLLGSKRSNLITRNSFRFCWLRRIYEQTRGLNDEPRLHTILKRGLQSILAARGKKSPRDPIFYHLKSQSFWTFGTNWNNRPGYYFWQRSLFLTNCVAALFSFSLSSNLSPFYGPVISWPKRSNGWPPIHWKDLLARLFPTYPYILMKRFSICVAT